MSKTITITINGKPVKTRVDKNGVQRLPRVREIAELFDCEALDLNNLAVAVKQDHTCAVETRRWVYQRLGYSVAGYAEVFPQDEIVNPMWEKGGRKKV
jgi:hypothetical protein